MDRKTFLLLHNGMAMHGHVTVGGATSRLGPLTPHETARLNAHLAVQVARALDAGHRNLAANNVKPRKAVRRVKHGG